MDAQVDSHLGDTIIYMVNGQPLESAPGVPTIPGFVILNNDDGGGYEGIQPHRERWRCKIHRRYLPDGPSPKHRIQSVPKLEGTYKPGSDTADRDGSYWLFDIQKAPA